MSVEDKRPLLTDNEILPNAQQQQATVSISNEQVTANVTAESSK
jgi:hypothetical protein